jgi:hypothetical protein
LRDSEIRESTATPVPDFVSLNPGYVCWAACERGGASRKRGAAAKAAGRGNLAE